MRELEFVAEESDGQSLVLRLAAPSDADGEKEFFLPVTQELRALLGANPAAAGTTSAGGVVGAAGASDPDATPGSDTSNSPDTAHTPHAASGSRAAGVAGDSSAAGARDDAADGACPAADAAAGATAAAGTDPHAESGAKSAAGEDTSDGVISGRAAPRPHRHRITLSPRVIQDRMRHGASIAQLAEEADTDESRIEPYAWPILQERSRIAELARASHPAGADGVSERTLWEALAAALAARGEDVSDTQWDAYQDQARTWIVTVGWDKSAAGETHRHVAEFTFELDPHGGPNVSHPMNSVASDLVNPRFGGGVRQVSAVTAVDFGGRNAAAAEVAPSGGSDSSFLNDAISDSSHPSPTAAPKASPGSQPSREGAEDGAEGFLLHPDGADAAEQSSKRRRRKAVTPHWEDVLLGVRTNPRKKK